MSVGFRVVFSAFSLLAYCGSSWAVNPPVWSYDGGPASWPEAHPDCEGYNQSPIDIASTSDARRPPIGVWSNYDVTPVTMTIGNDGKKVVLTGTSAAGLRPTIQNHKYKVYQLQHVEIHFGKNDLTGSEHAIDGTRYAMEVSAVHRRMRNGVFVIPYEYLITSTLYQASSTRNPGLSKIAGFLRYLTNPFESFDIPAFAWSQLIPPFTSNYFTYKGSLTAPPCSETAFYFINQNIQKVSAKQLTAFRSLLNHNGKPMGGNFRPLQPRNARNIFRAD